MHGPPWVGWLLVLLCAGAGAYCLSSVRRGTAAQRREARGEALMGLGMAAMAVPATTVAQPPWTPWAFAAVFGAAGLWALLRRHPHHAVGAAAMVYMSLAMVSVPGGGPGGGHATPTGSMAHVESTGPGGLPMFTVLLLAYYAVYIVAAGVRLAPAATPGAGDRAAQAPARASWPEVVGACRVAMGIGMFAMLLTL
ncbi:DUF5134 domain-containing protein [Streptomyces chrestomyceticus JCM 4735]|uniref:DUF5134 domain-containing protein n=1 Tax=Streptomyces chrestomyceticus JCM 4735 TaxID=1306181 RepID=A0A7U9Q1S4_9ACTN|nr:DUF5134 domain-containing protein [Streptomyces chrestomyceticus]GCD39185.1 DUF5134 domain-containing protein [Streptomyces chrestomyceticus JCM 4735]